MNLFYAMITLAIFDLSSYGSTYLSIDNGGEKYCVSTWRHTEDREDSVIIKEYSADSLREIEYYIAKNKSAVFIFNNGVFTSMRYGHGETKKWAALTSGEKNMITFLLGKFDLNEIPIYDADTIKRK